MKLIVLFVIYAVAICTGDHAKTRHLNETHHHFSKLLLPIPSQVCQVFCFGPVPFPSHIGEPEFPTIPAEDNETTTEAVKEVSLSTNVSSGPEQTTPEESGNRKHHTKVLYLHPKNFETYLKEYQKFRKGRYIHGKQNRGHFSSNCHVICPCRPPRICPLGPLGPGPNVTPSRENNTATESAPSEPTEINETSTGLSEEDRKRRKHNKLHVKLNMKIHQHLKHKHEEKHHQAPYEILNY